MDIPKSAMEAAEHICTKYGISLFDDCDKVALIIAEPINKAIDLLGQYQNSLCDEGGDYRSCEKQELGAEIEDIIQKLRGELDDG